MSYGVEQLEAAQALSVTLKNHSIQHAIIGGFALRLLGHYRSTQDVDVVIDMTTNKRDEIMSLLMSEDDRFTMESYKLFFTLSGSGYKVMIETLPLGELGLPGQLRVLELDNSIALVLHPAVLVLTKMKRCVHFIGSTRPQSVIKFHNDLIDIEFLLRWLVMRNEKIDFVGYHSAAVDRLYQAVASLVNYFQQTGKQELVDQLGLALELTDRQIVMPEKETGV